VPGVIMGVYKWNPTTKKATFIKSTTASTYTVTDLEQGEHSFVVYTRQKNASNAWEFGNMSEVVTANITADWKDAPTNLTATVEGTSVVLTWEHAIPGVIVGVYKWNPETNKATFIAHTTAGTYTVADLEDGEYSFIVYTRQKNSSGTWEYGTKSAPVTATVSNEEFTYTAASNSTVTISGYNGTETTVVIPSTTASGKQIVGVDAEAFKGNTSITAITFPSTVKTIGDSAFEDCTALATVTFKGSMDSIGSMAFKGCVAISSFEFPNGLTEISASVLENCTSLASVVMPNTITKICQAAFKNCTNLSSSTTK